MTTVYVTYAATLTWGGDIQTGEADVVARCKIEDGVIDEGVIEIVSVNGEEASTLWKHEIDEYIAKLVDDHYDAIIAKARSEAPLYDVMRAYIEVASQQGRLGGVVASLATLDALIEADPKNARSAFMTAGSRAVAELVETIKTLANVAATIRHLAKAEDVKL